MPLRAFVLLALPALALTACGSSTVSADRLEASIMDAGSKAVAARVISGVQVGVSSAACQPAEGDGAFTCQVGISRRPVQANPKTTVSVQRLQVQAGDDGCWSATPKFDAAGVKTRLRGCVTGP